MLMYLLLALGSFLLGMYAEEQIMFRKERIKKNIIRATGPSNQYWFWGMTLIAASLVAMVLNDAPTFQQMLERANQVRSASTAGDQP